MSIKQKIKRLEAVQKAKEPEALYLLVFYAGDKEPSYVIDFQAGRKISTEEYFQDFPEERTNAKRLGIDLGRV